MPDERSTVEILKAARERISGPARWTQNAFARRADGEIVAPDSSVACRWCAGGALRAEANVHDGKSGRSANHFLRVAAIERVGGEAQTSVPRFNDWAIRKHSEVVGLYDRAIELAEAAA